MSTVPFGVDSSAQFQAVKFGNPMIYNTPTPASYSSTATYLASDLVGGIIVNGNAGAITSTFPSASALAAALKAGGCPLNPGDTIECLIVNGGTGAITLALGSGMTFDANQGGTSQVVAINASKWIQLRFTNTTPGSEALVVYS